MRCGKTADPFWLMKWKKLLGIPVVPISAAKNEGIDELVSSMPSM